MTTAPGTGTWSVPAAGLLAAAVGVAVVNLVAQVGAWSTVAQAGIWLFMPLLGAWGLAAAPRPLPRPLALLLLGTVFAWGGDVLLSLPGEAWFPLGMASFAVMQVLYVAAFRTVPGPGMVRAWPVAWLPYVLVWATLVLLIRPGAGVLFWPVLAYSVLLVVMAVQALDLVLRVPRGPGWSVMWGGVLFVVSDGLIALRKFTDLLPEGRWTSFMVMLTYVAAQVLIVTGFVRAVRGLPALSRPSRSSGT